MSDKIVMVSGCYDLLHAGHVAFFKTAAQYGKVHVYVGQDQNIKLLKGKAPYFSQEERKYMVGAVRYVEKANIASAAPLAVDTRGVWAYRCGQHDGRHQRHENKRQSSEHVAVSCSFIVVCRTGPSPACQPRNCTLAPGGTADNE